MLAALETLAEQHDMLRARFVMDADGWSQIYTDTSTGAKMSSIVVSMEDDEFSQPINDRVTKLQSQFDFEDGPLWQAVHLAGFADGSSRLIFALHHLIVDAVSWRILADDLQSLLTQANPSTATPLGNKTSSYRQWSQAIRDWAHNNTQQTRYWRAVMQDFNSDIELDAHRAHKRSTLCFLKTPRRNY